MDADVIQHPEVEPVDLLLSEKLSPPPPWDERVAVLYGHRVQVAVLGDIAVHRSTMKLGKWTISALPSKSAIVKVDSMADALKLGMAIRSKMYTVWKEEDFDEALKQIPAWAFPWVRACRDQGKYLDPVQYEPAAEEGQ